MVYNRHFFYNPHDKYDRSHAFNVGRLFHRKKGYETQLISLAWNVSLLTADAIIPAGLTRKDTELLVQMRETDSSDSVGTSCKLKVRFECPNSRHWPFL